MAKAVRQRTVGASRILICGGRDFLDYDLLKYTLDGLLLGSELNNITIIQGGAKGADFLAKVYANSCTSHEVECLEFPAAWFKYGKKAGFIRNQTMLEEGKPDLVVAFSGGKGTEDMVSKAVKAGVEVLVVGQ